MFEVDCSKSKFRIDQVSVRIPTLELVKTAASGSILLQARNGRLSKVNMNLMLMKSR